MGQLSDQLVDGTLSHFYNNRQTFMKVSTHTHTLSLSHTRSLSLSHTQVASLTCDVGLQGFGNEGLGDLQLLRAAAARLQAERQAHALQHLHVIVDLKHVVEVEQILKPAETRALVRDGRAHGAEHTSHAHLSLEMLQSMTVLLLVLTMMKGR